MKQLVDFAGTRPNAAYLYAILGNFTLAIAQMFFKRLTTYLHPFQAIFTRSLCIALMNVCLMRKDDKQPYIKSPLYFFKVISRICVSTFSFVFMLYCLGYIPVSTVTTLFNMGPIFIYFIEVILYKHQLSYGSFLITLVSFSGVILLVQPQFIFGVSQVQNIDGFSFYVSLMIISAFANALNLHFVHGLAKKVDPMVNMHYSHLGNILGSSVLCNFSPKVMELKSFNLSFILLIVCVSVTGIFAQNLIFLANSLKKPSLMMPFGYVGVTAGFLFDLYMFDIQFTLLSGLGIFLTSAGLLSGFLLQVSKKDPSKSSQQLKQIQIDRRNENILVSLDQTDQKSPKM